MLTQQVELNNEHLEIGIVTDAAFIRDTMALLDGPKTAPPVAPEPAPAAHPLPATAQDADAVSRAQVGQAVAD